MSNGLQGSYQNGSNVIVFDQGLDRSLIDDVLVSELCAQLVAARKIADDASAGDWNDFYLQELKIFTWTFSHLRQHSISAYTLQGATPQSEMMKLFAQMPEFHNAYLTAALMQAVSARPLAEQRLPPLNAGEAGHTGDHTQIFHVSAVDANAILHCVRISLRSHEAQTKSSVVLPIESGQVAGNVDILAFSAELSDIGYDDYREGLKEKMADKSRELTMRLWVSDDE